MNLVIENQFAKIKHQLTKICGSKINRTTINNKANSITNLLIADKYTKQI